jgi:hypothetical protein
LPGEDQRKPGAHATITDAPAAARRDRFEMAALGRSRAMISLRGSIFWTIDNNIAIYDYVSPCAFCLPSPSPRKRQAMNETILITGTSSGYGKATADFFLERAGMWWPRCGAQIRRYSAVHRTGCVSCRSM